MCAQWEAKDPRFLHADREDSDRTGWMPRLICLRGRTGHFVGFVVLWLINREDQVTLVIFSGWMKKDII